MSRHHMTFCCDVMWHSIVTRLDRLYAMFMTECADSLCYVMWHHMTIWCDIMTWHHDVIWRLWKRKLTRRAQCGRVCQHSGIIIILKADRPHPRDKSTHRQIPRSDNDSSLLFVSLGKAEPLISTAACQRFDLDLDPWPWLRPLTLTLTFDLDLKAKTQFLAFDIDLWPATLTYNPNLDKVKVDLHTKNWGRRSNSSAVRALTNTRTDRCYQVHYLPALR